MKECSSFFLTFIQGFVKENMQQSKTCVPQKLKSSKKSKMMKRREKYLKKTNKKTITCILSLYLSINSSCVSL